MECPFCKLDSSRTAIIKTTSHSKVILSNPRLVRGHLLVIPKEHVVKLGDLNAEEQMDLVYTCIQFQEKIITDFAPGCDIRQNYRPFQKQGAVKVDHLHIHLIPRKFKDEYYQQVQQNEKELFTWLSDEERKNIIDIFK